jgi:surface polysaccharide O-acyltransferase-like enzyme
MAAIVLWILGGRHIDRQLQQSLMNLERVTFGFFAVLSLTLNFVFVMSDAANPGHHNIWVLTVAMMEG